MIDYKLSKKLKDIGFPQEYQKTKPIMDWAYDDGEELHLLHSDNDTGWWIGNDYTHSDMKMEEVKKDWVKCPTLSELIKACGRLDFKLRQTYSAYENLLFYVIERPGMDDMERCSTPEEAVANLYLELNKKS